MLNQTLTGAFWSPISIATIARMVMMNAVVATAVKKNKVLDTFVFAFVFGRIYTARSPD